MSASFPLALIGREGFVRMIGVDMIGEIRRAYFEQHWPIKEIVRTLSVSRATVRKVVRSQKTELKYERGIQGRARQQKRAARNLEHRDADPPAGGFHPQ